MYIPKQALEWTMVPKLIIYACTFLLEAVKQEPAYHNHFRSIETEGSTMHFENGKYKWLIHALNTVMLDLRFPNVSEEVALSFEKNHAETNKTSFSYILPIPSSFSTLTVFLLMHLFIFPSDITSIIVLVIL